MILPLRRARLFPVQGQRRRTLVAINPMLHQRMARIEHLFDGFIKASVYAIDRPAPPRRYVAGVIPSLSPAFSYNDRLDPKPQRRRRPFLQHVVVCGQNASGDAAGRAASGTFEFVPPVT